jgi:hypothetical protein
MASAPALWFCSLGSSNFTSLLPPAIEVAGTFCCCWPLDCFGPPPLYYVPQLNSWSWTTCHGLLSWSLTDRNFLNFFCSAKDQTQGLVYANQVLYCDKDFLMISSDTWHWTEFLEDNE